MIYVTVLYQSIINNYIIRLYHISSINTTFLISNPVRYNLNTNNIDIRNSNFYQQRTLEQYRMPLCYSRYYSKLSYNNGNFIKRIQFVINKQRGNITGIILLNMQLTHILIRDGFKQSCESDCGLQFGFLAFSTSLQIGVIAWLCYQLTCVKHRKIDQVVLRIIKQLQKD